MKLALAGGLMAAAIAVGTASAQTQLVSEDIMVKSPDAGIEIFVRNKRPANMTAFRPERTLLYVHGATYPASTAFDLKLDGLSWMEYIAARGYDVYLIDLRGYGRSTRPPEMAQKPDANPPIVRGDTAVKDIGAAVDFILARRNIRLGDLRGSFASSALKDPPTRPARRCSCGSSCRSPATGGPCRWCLRRGSPRRRR